MDVQKTLKALADINRLRIMNLLLKGELCVCEIEEILGLSQTNVSRHLNKLAIAGLLRYRKESQWVFYKVNADFIKEHFTLVKYLKASFENNETCRLDADKLLKAKREVASTISLKCKRS